MDFSLKTKQMKDSMKLTLTVDGSKEVIDRIEAAIHESLGSIPKTINVTYPSGHRTAERPGSMTFGGPDSAKVNPLTKIGPLTEGMGAPAK
jgi:hypothetical protein